MSHIAASNEQVNTSSHHGAISSGELAVGVIIGRTSEFFDFFVFAIASVIVFPRLVFPFLDPLNGTLVSFTLFALAFIARPLGTALFVAVDRRWGRSIRMTVTLVVLGTSTVAIGFLPGYAQVGALSVWLLALARVGQGLALGGTWDGLASLLALSAPEGRRGWYAMIPQLGAPLGLFVASALFAYLAGGLSTEDFFDWGWRYPFFVAFAINVVALFARLRIVETPSYKALFESQELHPSSVPEVVRAEGFNLILGTFAPLASFALFHMVTVFPLSWSFLFTTERPSDFLWIETAAALVGLVAIVASGFVSDRIGRLALLAGSAVAIAVYSGFAPQLLGGGLLGDSLFMVIGFVLLGLSFGQSSGAIASRLSRAHRYTGSALISDLAWLFGAGFAPLVALFLSSRFGLIASGGYLLSGAVCTLVALWASGALRRSLD